MPSCPMWAKLDETGVYLGKVDLGNALALHAEE